ncbi:MAG: lytic transglycosylase domain-containing protein [Chloroflexi bacterium]|nr:lytic transglycosylase domain-containing protein [Chloroflexota bacterium]
MGKTNLKNKVPRRSRRTLAIELLFFASLAVFGFALVTSLITLNRADDSGGISIREFIPGVAAQEPEPVNAFGLFERTSTRETLEPSVSPIFTPSVQYWADDIMRWSAQHGVDPNLAATVMQIESCGWQSAESSAGAMGLFQVMPFHFTAGEQPYDPDTNARRGLAYLKAGLEIAGGHAGLAMAGYNGGHSVINRDYTNWAGETQRYYRWGTGIYREASAGWESSPTLQNWLTTGGASLCAQAEAQLNLTQSR